MNILARSVLCGMCGVLCGVLCGMKSNEINDVRYVRYRSHFPMQARARACRRRRAHPRKHIHPAHTAHTAHLNKNNSLEEFDTAQDTAQIHLIPHNPMNTTSSTAVTLVCTRENAAEFRELIKAWPELGAVVEVLQEQNLFPGLRAMRVGFRSDVYGGVHTVGALAQKIAQEAEK